MIIKLILLIDIVGYSYKSAEIYYLPKIIQIIIYFINLPFFLSFFFYSYSQLIKNDGEIMKKLIQLFISISLFFIANVYANGTGYIFVSSEKDNSIMVLDGKTYAQVKTIETSDRPRHLAFNKDKTEIYAACGEGDSIDVIDIAKLEVTRNIDNDIEDPEAFDTSPDGKFLYISLEDDGALGVYDLEKNEMIKTVEVGEEPEGVLTSADGKSVYVTSEVANMVHVVSTEDWDLKANIKVGQRPRRFANLSSKNELWVTSELDASLSIIDTDTNKVKEIIRFEPEGFRREDITPVGITMSKDGKTAYVAIGKANHVAIINIEDRKVEDYILVGERAWNITLNSDESLLLVVNGLSDDISIIDTKKRKVIKSIPVGRVPYMALIDD